MAIRLTWICDNPDAYLTLYKSEEPLNTKDLPIPLATDVAFEYIDEDDKEISYYLVSSEFDGKIFYSEQVSSESIIAGVFVFDLTQSYTPPNGNIVNFLGMA